MRVRRCLLLVKLLFLIVLILASSVLAQECEIIKYNSEDGTYLVKVGNKTMLAITEEMAKEMLMMKQDLTAARKEIEAQKILLDQYEKIKSQFDTTLSHQKEYIEGLEVVLEGHKKIQSKYKRLNEPWLTVETGVGGTGDSDPAVLFGLGIKQLRIWGFLQESNSGGLIGVSLPIF